MGTQHRGTVAVSRETQRQFAAAATRVRQYAGTLRVSVAVAVRLIGEEIMTDVKASRAGHGVPVDTGALRSSGRVRALASSGGAGVAAVELSFGGASAPYALIQHENMQYHHAVGEARYLVRGVERWRPGGSAAMAALRRQAAVAAAVGRQ